MKQKGWLLTCANKWVRAAIEPTTTIPYRRLTDFSCRTISARVNPLCHDRHTGVRPLPSTSTVYDRSLGWSGADCESAGAAAGLSREDRGSPCYSRLRIHRGRDEPRPAHAGTPHSPAARTDLPQHRHAT